MSYFVSDFVPIYIGERRDGRLFRDNVGISVPQIRDRSLRDERDRNKIRGTVLHGCPAGQAGPGRKTRDCPVSFLAHSWVNEVQLEI